MMGECRPPCQTSICAAFLAVRAVLYLDLLAELFSDCVSGFE